MPVNKDQEAIRPFVEEGDYVARIVKIEPGVSKGKATAGSDNYNVKLHLESPTVGMCYETLIDHPSYDWKLDTFLKCFGVEVPKGASYEFDQAQANANGCFHADMTGRRGWVAIGVEEYLGKKRNRVTVFYTDKPKFQFTPVQAAPLADWDTPAPNANATASFDDDDETPF